MTRMGAKKKISKKRAVKNPAEETPRRERVRAVLCSNIVDKLDGLLLEDAIKYLQSLTDPHLSEHRFQVEYDYDLTRLYLVGYREETDEEFLARTDKARYEKEKKLKFRLAQIKKLQQECEKLSQELE